MSDGFDKEAEREKLREKFADDEQKREHTQRMSELLLQGATMTNRHCDNCGDPIFRHDGQEFCPSCQATGQQAEPGDAATSDTQQATQPDAGHTQADASASDDDVASSTPRAAENGAPTPTGGQTPPADATRNPADAPQNPATHSPEPPETPSSSQSSAAPADAPGTGDKPAAPADSGSVADARASLTRTLTRFARAAEATDDPRRARDHLQAAREAAEALDALD